MVTILGYFIAGFVGFVLGCIVTNLLLIPKNLETYKAIEAKFSNSASDTISTAKALYKMQVDEYENNAVSGEESEQIVSEETLGEV